MSRPFVHTLDEEVRSISGYYVLRKEGLIDYRGEKILFLIGEAQADSACCGHGSCRYALVPGFVRSWKSFWDEEGRPVSVVEPLEDPEVKGFVKRRIMEAEGVPQVQFW